MIICSVLKAGDEFSGCCLRIARDRELERKVKDYTNQMQERRKNPSGNPQEDMEAAKRELAMVTQAFPFFNPFHPHSVKCR